MSDEPSTYIGVDRRGEGRTGVTTEPPIRLVGQRFEQGWRSLTMTRGGHIVGEIFRHADRPHRRAWWAEKEGATP